MLVSMSIISIVDKRNDEKKTPSRRFVSSLLTIREYLFRGNIAS